MLIILSLGSPRHLGCDRRHRLLQVLPQWWSLARKPWAHNWRHRHHHHGPQEMGRGQALSDIE